MRYFCFVLFSLAFISCWEGEVEPRNVSFDEIAGNETIKEYMATFESTGIMSDSTSPPDPQVTLASFTIPTDLKAELLLAEPKVNQPVEINFDHRGRMWVVQYNQYPYPEGVKVEDIDNHSRVVYDKIPSPPGEGLKGADKITIYEDTNGDGQYDKATDAITGLNITTGVSLGRGQIWVLTPPYLVAYPDPDGDGLPDGEAVVHLSGFGLEDTHAVANSLRWGPDGWLYGAQGSTCISTINSGASKNVHFKGQAIWRYHPESAIFEVFGEGGGNTFDTEFDAKGRMFSGDNGTTRGFFYKQGGYYRKNWGKHGALTNPYAFGYLPGLELVGKKMRFTHAWIKYEGSTLPERYHNRILALNPLHNFVQVSRMEPKGSTFLCTDEEKILETEDYWFRPVDIKAGPDGGVYLADWSDSRMSHVNPIDNWDKQSGRIYRLGNLARPRVPAFDLSKQSNEELIALLRHENKWFRQQALRIIGDRNDANALPQLYKLFRSGDGQTALEALWAINLSGGFSEAFALEAMDHHDPFVRQWSIRLVGDQKQATPALATKLVEQARQEEHLEVAGQLASSAKRLPSAIAVPILGALLRSVAVQTDPENQLLCWWGLEAHVESGRDQLLQLFADPEFWEYPIVQDVILSRLLQRYALAGGKQNYLAAAKLLEMVPSFPYSKAMMEGLEEGLRGRDIALLPEELTSMMRHFQVKYDAGRLSIALRENQPEAVTKSLEVIADKGGILPERLAYLKIYGEINQPQCVPLLSKIAGDNTYKVAIRLACMQALKHYNAPEIGKTLTEAYAYKIRANPRVRAAALSLFSSRADWAISFLKLIYDKRAIKKTEVPLEVVRQFKLMGNEQINTMVDALWPSVQIASSADKAATALRIKEALAAGMGTMSAGKPIYQKVCGNCHRLGEEGRNIGPDLTGYDRRDLNYLVLNIVDPNADIREGYVNYLVEKKDGQALFGTLVDRSDAALTLRALNGFETTLAQSEIAVLEAQSTSLMPERIIEPLSDQEIRDLFAYLQQQEVN